MHANSTVPEPGTYGRVLRRYDRDPRHAHQMRFTGYDVTLRAVAAEMKGKAAPTLFFPVGKDTSAARATRLGWVDCTDEWNHWLHAPPEPTLREKLEAMTWNELQGHARRQRVDTSGKRPDVMARVLAHHEAQGDLD
jgi:hypothetical protein